MPIYSYACPVCGDFTETRSMDRASEPARCPDCGIAAQRVLVAPYISCLNPATRRAHERNERSADSPRVVSREDWQRESAPHQGHPHSHHGHHHRHGHEGARHGNSRYPWMIGH